MYCIYNETLKKYWNFEKNIFTSIDKGCMVPSYIQIQEFFNNIKAQYNKDILDIHCIVTKKIDIYVEYEM